MKRIIIIYIVIAFWGNYSFGQDTQLSQFYASPIFLAPSFAGSTDGDRFTLNYRAQWPELTKAYVMYVFGYDHYFPRLKSGLGLMVIRDQAGTGQLSTTNIGLAYSYNVAFLDNRWKFRPGLSFFYTQRNIDFDRLTFGDELVSGSTTGTAELPILEKKADIDASFSLLVYSKDMWAGFSFDHILMPERSLTGETSPEPWKFSIYGGAKIPVFTRYRRPSGQSLSPSAIVKIQDEYSQLDLGLYWYQMPLVLGIWYRGIPLFKNYTSSDAVAFLLGYKLDMISIGYSYDLTISKLIGFTGGTHEISINYQFNQGVTQRKRRRAIPCPSF